MQELKRKIANPRWFIKIILIIGLYWGTNSLAVANSPFFISYMKVDEIKIMHQKESVNVRDQEKINEFLESMKGTVIIPNSIGRKESTKAYVLAFYYKGKFKRVFAYDSESKELLPYGRLLNPELYSTISTFINENFKE